MASDTVTKTDPDDMYLPEDKPRVETPGSLVSLTSMDTDTSMVQD